jgi:hypothetical protein
MRLLFEYTNLTHPLDADQLLFSTRANQQVLFFGQLQCFGNDAWTRDIRINKDIQADDQACPRSGQLQILRNIDYVNPISRVQRELAKLDTSFIPTSNRIEEVDEEQIDDDIHGQVHYAFHSAFTSDPGKPRTLGT